MSVGSGPDRVRVSPAALAGEVHVPGDKSISHRCLLLGAMVGERVEVAGLAPSGDVLATAQAVRSLGGRVHLVAGEHGRLAGSVVGPLREPDDVVDCGNSGTALRLLAGVVAGVPGLSVLTGDSSLRRRPVSRVVEPLTRMGARLDAAADGTRPPLVVRGGKLAGITHTQPRASAQVKSCVLLAGLRASGDTTVVSPLPSRDHTERLLAHLGRAPRCEVAEDGTETVTLTPGALRAAPLAAAADPSSAAFWHVAAAASGGSIRTPGVSVNPTRAGALAALASLGATIERRDERLLAGEPVADVEVHGDGLAGAVRLAGRDVVDALDELPVLALAGAVAAGGIEVVDAAELRVKESDRITTTAAMLRALGVEVTTTDDGYRVAGGQRPRGGVVDAAGDHRIAMTAAIAGSVGDGPVTIDGFAAVATSYPSFLDDLRLLGGRVEVL